MNILRVKIFSFLWIFFHILNVSPVPPPHTHLNQKKILVLWRKNSYLNYYYFRELLIFNFLKKSIIHFNRKFIFSPTNIWFETTITFLRNSLQILGFCHILYNVSAKISNIAKLQFQFLHRIILAWKVDRRSKLLCGLWILLILNA